MYLRHLALANYRNFRRLDLSLAQGLTIFWGDNGQGKSNLLEAAYLLATSRSYRTSAERELVSWYADTSPVFARAAGEVVRHTGTSRLEVIIAGAPTSAAAAGSGENASTLGLAAAAGQVAAASVRRRVRINGHERPVHQLLGQFNAVMFAPEDVALVAGPAETRRRYLDITLCQVDQRYLRSLRRYVRVLTQRNALLRQHRERPLDSGSFSFWDEQLTSLGAELIVARLRAVAFLNTQLDTIYPDLTAEHGSGRLQLVYRSSVSLTPDSNVVTGASSASGASAGPVDSSASGSAPAPGLAPDSAAVEAVRQRFQSQLEAVRVRERQQGVTVVGVHRDDFAFMLGSVDLRTYGSRGQQRTAALALKLAEAVVMERTTGERPTLLLDDVMSELDPSRQAYLQQAVMDHEQVILTATDLAPFSTTFVERATRLRIRQGDVQLDT